MRILLIGLGKSGTTALLYKVAGGLPDSRSFRRRSPRQGKYLGDDRNAVQKHTYEESRGRRVDFYWRLLEREHYDRKVWITRDPRDIAISRMLYRWHMGSGGSPQQFQAHIDLVRKKERDPASVSFLEICRHAGHEKELLPTEEVLEEERGRYRRALDFVDSRGDDWFLFRYEDMIAGNFASLNAYLGFEVRADAKVPRASTKDKVARKRGSGDWRDWFTAADVDLLRPVYLPYMKRVGYDVDDWALSPRPLIDPRYASRYMKRLTGRTRSDDLRKRRNKLVRRLLERWSSLRGSR
jgi:hypothetical protein